MAVEVIATIKPKNNGKFPIVEAVDVDVNGKPLSEALNEMGNGNTPRFKVEDNDKLMVSYDNGETFEYLATLPIGGNGHTPQIIDGYWYINAENTNVKAVGKDGVGIKYIEKTATVGLVDVYTITLTNGDSYSFNVTNGSSGGESGGGGGADRTSPPTIKRTGSIVTVSVTPEQMDDAFGDMTICYRVFNGLDNNKHTNHTNHIIRNESSIHPIDITNDEVFDPNGKGKYYVEAYAIALGRTKSNPSISETYDFQKYEPLNEADNLCFMNTEFITFPLDIAKVVDINDWNEALANIPIVFGAPVSGVDIEEQATHISFEIEGDILYIRDADNDIVICEVVDGVPVWSIDCSEWFILPHEQEVPLSFAIWFGDNCVSTESYYNVSNMAFEFYTELNFEDWYEEGVIRAYFRDDYGHEYGSIRFIKEYSGMQPDRIFFDNEPMPSTRITFGDNAYIPYDTDEYGWFWRNGALVPQGD